MTRQTSSAAGLFISSVLPSACLPALMITLRSDLHPPASCCLGDIPQTPLLFCFSSSLFRIHLCQQRRSGPILSEHLPVITCLFSFSSRYICTHLILVFSFLSFIFASVVFPQTSCCFFPCCPSFFPLQYHFNLYSFMEALPQYLFSWNCSAHVGYGCWVTSHHTSVIFLCHSPPLFPISSTLNVFPGPHTMVYAILFLFSPFY